MSFRDSAHSKQNRIQGMRPCVERYYAFKNEIRAHGVKIPEWGATIIFHMPMPKSWSGKKRSEMAGQPHRQRPDLDNLIKAIFDAVFDEDSHIWNYQCSKYWADKGCIIITEI